MPASWTRRRSQSGLGRFGSIPVTVRATNRSQPAGSSIRTSYPRPFGFGVSSSAGSRSSVSYAIAVSRATPRSDSAYPRSGVTAMSSTSSRRPSSSMASAPTSASGGRTRMPLWSSPRPSSRAEQIMPLEIWP